MAESQVEKKQGTNSLALSINDCNNCYCYFSRDFKFGLSRLYQFALGGTYVSGGAIYDAIYVILTIATDVLYLFGGGVITFGALLVTIRFIQLKLKDPYQPSFSTRYLSGYLTLSLNFFIGAEIIRTVAVRDISRICIAYSSDFQPRSFQLDSLFGKKMAWNG